MLRDRPGRLPYPPARQGEVVDVYHGVSVPDPYRWLEEPEAPETQAFVEAQNRLTASWIREGGLHERLATRLRELWDYERHSVPQRHGPWLYYVHNLGLQDQAPLYRQAGPDGEPGLVLDPNRLSGDGTVSLSGWSVSRDGERLAWNLSRKGSDWQELRVRDVAAGRDWPEVLRGLRWSSAAWLPDGSGFYYARFPLEGTVPEAERLLDNRLYLHRVGTGQESDELVLECPADRELGFGPHVTEDGRWLVVSLHRNTDPCNRLWFRALGAHGPFVRLVDDEAAGYRLLGNVGATFYFNTTLDAPRGRVVSVDVSAGAGPWTWREVVPQADGVLDAAALVGGRLVLSYEQDAHHRLIVAELDGRDPVEVALPGPGSVAALSAREEDDELFFMYTSYLHPITILRCDVRKGQARPWREPRVRADLSGYETRQVFFRSKDGTRIPMFLTHRKGLSLDGSNPTLLYGYGGFAVSLTPSFAASLCVWLERGGVYAVANLRGGNEYGRAWHEAAKLEKKQNVFDDFIGAAEWLQAEGYTRPDRLAIKGGSNGGLLVAACMLQRPDLFGAVVCGVPLTDMLRYHRFTCGRFWICEYGNAEADPEHFRFLHAYSPLHNVRPGRVHPAALISSADTDDRVVPSHAKKFAAALQAADAGTRPLLLRVETKAGHGAGTPTSKRLRELADEFAFLVKALRMSEGAGEGLSSGEAPGGSAVR